ncbi:MAG: hypothetical protein JWP94_486 [Mucilaginibacter sp.]|nr:hypothetical protein [Mucilaginibacter sp.]
MVRSELGQLERLIGEVVKDEDVAQSEANLARMAEQVQAVADTCSGLKLKWVRELFSGVREPVLARYVQYHQAGVTSLSDQVSRKIPAGLAEDAGDPIHQYYFIVLTNLEALLRFLKQGFYKYFDGDYPVSIYRFRIQSEEISRSTAENEIALHQSGVDDNLITSITTSVTKKLSDAWESGISYRQFDHIKSVLSRVAQKVRENPDVTTIDVAHELYGRNFNSYYFLQWYKHRLSTMINAVAENEKLKIILQETKALEMIFVSGDVLFEPELPPINEQLLPWLRQQSPDPSNLSAIFKMNGHERMPLRFSVTQFAFFIRLCYLTGCFRSTTSPIF